MVESSGAKASVFVLSFSCLLFVPVHYSWFSKKGGLLVKENIPKTANMGLDGIVAFTSEISDIIDNTLSYCGYTIEDLAEHSSYEEAAFLLWNRRLPKHDELNNWKKMLSRNMTLPKAIIPIMQEFPKTTAPMEVLRSSISLLSLWDPDQGDNSPEAIHRQAIRLVARVPALVAAWHRIRNSWDVLSPLPNKSVSANFFYLLFGEEAQARFVEVFDTALLLHADHTMNASTFAARVTTSTLSDLYSSITTAVGTLKGPLHGGANEQVMYMLEKIGGVNKVDAWLKGVLERKEKIMGFGHRVYKNGDPRAKILQKMSEEICGAVGKLHLYEMSVRLHEKLEKEKGLLPNVDFYSASLYHSLGIPIDLFTPVFAASRISGWLAQIMEQRKNNRLIRPLSTYVGEKDRKWVPVEER